MTEEEYSKIKRADSALSAAKESLCSIKQSDEAMNIHILVSLTAVSEAMEALSDLCEE